MISWVADHRKHHAFSDQRGRPAQPARRSRRRPARRAARPCARPRRLAVHPHPPRGQGALRAGPARRPGRALRRPDVPGLGARRACGCRSGSAWRSAARWRPGSRACSGAGRCGCSSCTTSPTASTRSATSSAAAASRPATSRATWPGWRRSPSARPGTTTTTPSRPPPPTGCAAGRSTPRRAVIRVLERLGLAWDVVRVTPERQAAKARGADAGAMTRGAATAPLRTRAGRGAAGAPVHVELLGRHRAAGHQRLGPTFTSPRRGARRTCCGRPGSSASAART